MNTLLKNVWAFVQARCVSCLEKNRLLPRRWLLLSLLTLLLGCTTPPPTFPQLSAALTATAEPLPADLIATVEPLPADLPTSTASIAAALPTSTPPPTTPLVTAVNSPVNLRAGPGTNYDVVGLLPQGESLPIVGRNIDSTWWQVMTSNGLQWISAAVTQATLTESGIRVVAIPATPTSPPPTNTPPPPPATNTPPLPTPTPAPQFQYSLRNVFGQVNEAITQIRGEVRDRNGNPVNGVRIRVRSGSFCTVSNPSGPQGGYPNGNYDILLDNFAKDGQWLVAIVSGPADPNNHSCDGTTDLSQEVVVPTSRLEGVSYVDWWKNY